ncbi:MULTISPECIES: hypothetical protein [unclassified Chamaesiphon]|uniref:hypothetical protein n=1 Tax=unclassified Chamaesiphon TaxID=2620921 RepID=UPI00286A4C4E|nr:MULTISPECIES: hypothetical protein [unclassified Chamaesiphon]
MKIQLQRRTGWLVGGKPTPLEHRLDCVACQHSFTSNRLGTLLCHDDGSIVGDICMGCLRQGASHLQQQLKRRSISLFQQPPSEASPLSVYRRALELSELATQPLAIPAFYVWWWQRLTTFVADTQELDKARRAAINCRHRQPKPTNITFSTEKPSKGKDD